MKRGLFQLTLFIVFFFLFNQQALGWFMNDQVNATCSTFVASVTDRGHVTLKASGCSVDGRYYVRIYQNNEPEPIVSGPLYIDAGEGDIAFHLDRVGNYQARLFFGHETQINSTNFSVQSTDSLKCGDPANENDLRCPEDCPSRRRGGGWFCLNPYSVWLCRNMPPECAQCIEVGKFWTALGCIPFSPMDIVKWIFPYLLGLGGLSAFLLIVFSGIRILTSAGNPEAIQGAKETITSAVTGLLFVILSLFLLRLIGVEILGLPGLN